MVVEHIVVRKRGGCLVQGCHMEVSPRVYRALTRPETLFSSQNERFICTVLLSEQRSEVVVVVGARLRASIAAVGYILAEPPGCHQAHQPESSGCGNDR